MPERYTTPQVATVIAAVIAGFSLHIFIEQFFTYSSTSRLASGDECLMRQNPNQNPNKMLFINCGGFLQ
ncbi:hypothetical protein HY971_02060 [Candidatus Kaiserbacteria bacterium]|nr:hypothetical protein [Candidatus Kaiserbacteria bacterium]